MPKKAKNDSWIERFVQYASYGEANPKILYWTAISTIAGALRRKVWYDHIYWQWSPNFYIIIVAPPGIAAKSTNIDVGHRLLRDVDGITFGPDIASWQALLRYMGENQETVEVEGEDFKMSCVTLSIAELGVFFDFKDSKQIDNLVNLWDCKLGILDKRTTTNGNDQIENPWVNLMAGTTPSWVAENVSEYMLNGGLLSRCIFVYVDHKYKIEAFPADNVPPNLGLVRAGLVRDLQTISSYSGRFTFTPDAKEWVREWYNSLWSGDQVDLDGRRTRMYAHLTKLGMVFSAAEFKFPLIEVKHVIQANAILKETEATVAQVVANVGQSAISKSAKEIVELVFKAKHVGKRELYRKSFFRKMSYEEYEQAVESAVRAELVMVKNEGGEVMLCSL